MKPIVPAFLLLFLMFLWGCNKAGFNRLESAVQDNLVTFGPTEIPVELDYLVESNRIVIFGETHYVQEHHDYISLLLHRFGPGGLCFFNEFPNAFNWMIEDYINGESNQISNSIRTLNHTWIESIREINLSDGLPGPIQFICMDVNHVKGDFKYSIREAEKLTGEQNLFALIKILKEDGNAYLKELYDLQEIFLLEGETYLESMGEKWFRRYQSLVDMELESCRFRMTGEEAIRENTMYSIIHTTVSNNPGIKAFINCGLYHAQKETMMGTPMVRIGALLSDTYPDTRSICFVGIQGKRQYRFNDPEPVNFNVLESAEKIDLIRIIGSEASHQLALLLFEDEIFRKEMDATYTAGAVRVCPGKQFDAIISYPEITILESLSEYSY